jgi:PPP family 3-phenylpropionic acid transporter
MHPDPVSARLRVRPAVAVHGLFVFLGFQVAAFFPFFAIYLQRRGLSESEIGLVIAFMACSRILLNPVWGHLADARFGRLSALQLGLVGTSLCAFSMNFVHGVMPIAVGAFGIAGFMVATGPNIDTIALEHLGDERMSQYGKIRGWLSLSYSAACLAIGAVLQARDIRLAMPIFASAGLGVILWSTTVARDHPKHVDHGRMGTVGAVFREAPRFWGFLAAITLVWTGFNAAWNFIALKIVSEGGGPLLIGMGTALGGLMEVPVMRFSSRLQSRWGLRKVYATGCLIYATGFLLWGLISDPTIVSFLTVFEGMAFGLLFTTSVVTVGRLLPSNLYSTGNSMAAMVSFGIGPILGAGLGGFVYQHLGTTVLYAGASALALSGGVAAWFALKIPALEEPSLEGGADFPADVIVAPPEPLG